MNNGDEQFANDTQKGFLQVLIGDGSPLMGFVGLCLILSGGFALFLAATGQLLPHDVAFLGMTGDQLCRFAGCHILHFMFHDRVAFGGALIAVGTLYLWAAEFPLRQGRAWAWWLFVVSGTIGFASFLAYLGYGYLDVWHAAATLLLLPIFAVGLTKSYSHLREPKHLNALFKPAAFSWKSRAGIGRICLLLTAAGMIFGGLTIVVVGMTAVFVPQDLTYMNLTADDLNSISPRLVPLIAHDRAGFGGVLATTGTAVWFCALCGTASRSLWQALCIAGTVGFATAIGIHPLVGYNNLTHLAPAILGFAIFASGLILSYEPMMKARER